ncbi:hypothetical protein [Aestuariivirga sp.]|uniref:hypothetical protein n=1 Tax=Aestuariivirga sp. TaxID=2650926 RepID=UPI003BAA1875
MSTIKLPPFPPDGSVKIFGFFSTQEGRRFLRYCYGKYLALLRGRKGRAAFSHGKVGVIVADNEREETKTAQALRRWLEDTQADLWQGDIVKSTRVAERLEALLASEDEIRAMMSERASYIRTLDFAGSLSTFFYGGESVASRELTRQRLMPFSGLFSIWTLFHGHDRYEAYYYQSETFVRAVLHDELPTMTVQEFFLENGVRRHQRSGVQFVSETGTIFRYLVSNADPSFRWSETLTAVEIDPSVKHMYPFAQRYLVEPTSISIAALDHSKAQRSTMVWGFGEQSNRDILLIPAGESQKAAVVAASSGSQWDVPL